MAPDPHEPFDSVTLTGPDGNEHDVTRLFQESPEERRIREQFYDTKPARSHEDIDAYIHTIKMAGSLSLQDRLNNLERVTITIAGADGEVIAAGEAQITAGFVLHETKDATIMERVHKAKVL